MGYDYTHADARDMMVIYLVTVDMRTRDLVLYCAGAGSRGLYIRNQYCGKEKRME